MKSKHTSPHNTKDFGNPKTLQEYKGKVGVGMTPTKIIAEMSLTTSDGLPC